MASISAIASDSPRNGIPQGNLSALKEFLSLKREQKHVHTQLPDECRSLPATVQIELRRLLWNINSTAYFQPIGTPNKKWYMYYGDTWHEAYAAVDAGWREGDATGTQNVAWCRALGAAMRPARRAGREAAALAASDAAVALAKSAVFAVSEVELAPTEYEAHERASTDAGLMAYLIAVSDLGFKGKDRHMAHARARWKVWSGGYGLHGDVNGVLYVYCKGEDPDE